MLYQFTPFFIEHQITHKLYWSLSILCWSWSRAHYLTEGFAGQAIIKSLSLHVFSFPAHSEPSCQDPSGYKQPAHCSVHIFTSWNDWLLPEDQTSYFPSISHPLCLLAQLWGSWGQFSSQCLMSSSFLFRANSNILSSVELKKTFLNAQFFITYVFLSFPRCKYLFVFLLIMNWILSESSLLNDFPSVFAWTCLLGHYYYVESPPGQICSCSWLLIQGIEIKATEIWKVNKETLFKAGW